MADASRWTGTSARISPRMFGIYREQEARGPRRKVNCKIIFLLFILAISALAVCWISVKLTAKKVSHDARLRFERTEGRADRSEVYSIPTQFTALPPGTASESGARLRGTLNRPQEPQVETEPYNASTEDTLTLESQSRTARTFGERTREARIVNRLSSLQDLDTGFTELNGFGDSFAQLAAYRPPRQDSVTPWLDRSPGLMKFTGVYLKAEDGRPFLNGHAYVSDPFVRFKPPHPAEINQLVDHDKGRFSNRPAADSGSSGSSINTHTQAVFHPYTPLRPRPLKIMLDIYPMVPEPGNRLVPGDAPLATNNRRPKATNNRMIVHLNLYPRKNNAPRISRMKTTTGDVMQSRMIDISNETATTTDFTTEFTYAEETTYETTSVTEELNETQTTLV